ncbi:hypothetical protein MVLG_06918 [Microbotryum lychnidis-dioicae p1A1 Lamole]|uniref:Uncharacterized protein n=1 Tax=Microbotryum lychnidis-dioicae (strain p1A1 Lamole / MvSl-1064) TaxID=683840 RepID=U5HIS0_USTV1|nr:hypothetical protein MVLG_06918 [Microbotryum lychnidis-dioicae p1A1 Lamole]|eukprot:KDE02536.1 hypothetical protein MVLG_06918 [Microbotryum lychnidis-dioicae p1A1 Lamole]
MPDCDFPNFLPTIQSNLKVLDHSGRAMSPGSGEDWYGSQVPDRNKRSIQAPSTLLHDGSSEHGLATSRKRVSAVAGSPGRTSDYLSS